MLTAQGLTKRYGDVLALAGFELSIAAGEIVGLIGRNGAGKSTFERVAAGIVPPDTGSVRIDGIDLARDPYRARGRLGLAGQELAVYPTATVAENLHFFGALQGLRGAALRRAIDDTCAALRIGELLPRRAAVLSGGQQRRVHTAAALLHRPPVLLLDEPTVGADPAGRAALLATLRARADEGAAICYTTHYLPELDLLRATLAIVSAGRVVARGTRRELLAEAGLTRLDDLLAHWTDPETSLEAHDVA